VLSRVLVLLTALCLAATTFVLVTDDVTPRGADALPRRVLAAHNDTSTPFNLVHLPRLARTSYDGRRLALRPASREDGVVHHTVTYRGAGLRLTGTLTRPARAGRFPLVVVAHAYRPPLAYEPHEVSRQERVYLARDGFVVLQPDYRNYGGSTREDDRLVEQPHGYPEDLLNAVSAVRRADLPFVRGRRVHLLGRSMGGGVALQAAVTRPTWFRSLVLSSPVSSSAADNFRHWVAQGTELRGKVVEAYGLPRDNRAFWTAASARSYVHRLQVPVQVHHGTADDVCPLAWSRGTVRAIRRTGGRARLYTYDGAEHAFHGNSWQLMMRRTVAAFRSPLPRERAVPSRLGPTNAVTMSSSTPRR
jgi:dipeptidyl aminopeptidase/acylaminoacyl peptidase